jgi:hypothetical protein
MTPAAEVYQATAVMITSTMPPIRPRFWLPVNSTVAKRSRSVTAAIQETRMWGFW